jgi:4-amino-4-deoxy-L-arabinose transferase-like glycosyltransferase
VATALALLIVLGGALRLAGIDAGNPYVYHPDEWYLAKTGMVMVRELDPLPHFYQYPSLMPILSAVVAAVVRGLGGPTLETDQPWLLEREVLPEQFVYFLAVRVLVAMIGLATILVVYLIGARLRGRTAGLAAAAIVAVSPLHITNSRFATTDVPLALAGAVALLVTIHAVKDGRDRWWAAAGIAAGIAASTKWNGLAILGVPLLACFLAGGRASDLVRPAALIAFARRRTPWLIGFAAVATVLAITPGLLLEFRTAGRNILQLGRHYGEAEPYSSVDSISYAAGALAQGLGPLVVVAALVGLALMLADRRPAEVPIPAFVAVYFLVVALAPRQYERNLMLLVPLLAVAAGAAVAETAARTAEILRRRTSSGETTTAAAGAVAAALLAVALIPGTVGVVQAATAPVGPDTRTIAIDWIHANIPAGSSIAREVYTPQVGPEYRVQQTFYLADLSLDEYRRRGVRYLIASESAWARFLAPGGAPEAAAFYEQLFKLPEIGRIERGPGEQGPRIQVFELAGA